MFKLAIEEINKNPDILPNVTLGYHLYDSCNDVNKATESVFNILSGSLPIPNYSCMYQYNLAGVIGDWSSEISMHIAQVLNLYGISQVGGNYCLIISPYNLHGLQMNLLYVLRLH